jgi:hypothetical protein
MKHLWWKKAAPGWNETAVIRTGTSGAWLRQRKKQFLMLITKSQMQQFRN